MGAPFGSQGIGPRAREMAIRKCDRFLLSESRRCNLRSLPKLRYIIKWGWPLETVKDGNSV